LRRRRLDEGVARTRPSAFGLDPEGEIVVVSFDGLLLRIVPP
jgi:hypothetical protein